MDSVNIEGIYLHEHFHVKLVNNVGLYYFEVPPVVHNVLISVQSKIDWERNLI